MLIISPSPPIRCPAACCGYWPLTACWPASGPVPSPPAQPTPSTTPGRPGSGPRLPLASPATSHPPGAGLPAHASWCAPATRIAAPARRSRRREAVCAVGPRYRRPAVLLRAERRGPAVGVVPVGLAAHRSIALPFGPGPRRLACRSSKAPGLPPISCASTRRLLVHRGYR
jgi:hypothetical protein